jgi:hypothetical protein
MVTDVSVSSLGQGCPLLRTISVGKSNSLASVLVTLGKANMTDKGLLTIATSHRPRMSSS